MQFDSLSYRYTVSLPEVPRRWIPLIHLYDPDLPLFPLFYFHVLRPGLDPRQRPSASERAYGYVDLISMREDGGIDAQLVTNKDLDQNTEYNSVIRTEIEHRFGIADPVRINDIENAFLPPLDAANPLLRELWYRVVPQCHGDKLPFGRLWDGVLGLARFTASWNPPSGRKSELIMTHYFASRFGVRISSSSDLPNNDFYLLPTYRELRDTTNPLSDFPALKELLRAATHIVSQHGTTRNLGNQTFTCFSNPFHGQFNSAKLDNMINGLSMPHHLRRYVRECSNAFGKNALRTIAFLLALHDLRNDLFNPDILTARDSGLMYDGLGSSYRFPKILQIYAQQCLGNTNVAPIDTWIDTFMKWPLKARREGRVRNRNTFLFEHSEGLGKVERLLWVAAQARKVHSSACNDVIWCTKYGSSQKEPRGANPLACNICRESMRDACPAFNAIRELTVGFNGASPDAHFQLHTSSDNNTTPNQVFRSCTGYSIYKPITDRASPYDVPEGYAPFPIQGHNGSIMSVGRFVEVY